MKLRTGLPYTSSVPPLEKNKERVTFNAVPVDPPVLQKQEVKEEVKITPEVPSLTKVNKEIPPLQPVRRVKKTVELSSPQSATATSVSAEPESGGDRKEVEAIENGNNTIPVNRNVPRTTVQLGVTHDNVHNDDSPSDGNDVYVSDGSSRHSERGSSVSNSSDGRDVLDSGKPADGPVPKLTKVEKPSTDIPPLVAFNTLEVAHLLLGRSIEDEEVVLIQSFSERFVRTKDREEFNDSLRRRISIHIQRLVDNKSYDFYERAQQRRLEVVDLSPAQKARGIEWAAAYRDEGDITQEDISIYAAREGISSTAARDEMISSGCRREPSYVYTWALVKVKIGHDFGSFKLSELMPNL